MDAAAVGAGGGTAMHAAAANLSIYTAAIAPRVRAKRSAVAQAVSALAAAGGSISAQAAGGLQPLHYAAGASARNALGTAAVSAVIRALVTAGAAVDATDAAGLTPLHHALRNRSPAGLAAISALVDPLRSAALALVHCWRCCRGVLASCSECLGRLNMLMYLHYTRLE